MAYPATRDAWPTFQHTHTFNDATWPLWVILNSFADALELIEANAVTKLAEVIPDGSVGTYTFSGIPQIYKHLEIRASLSGNTAGVAITVLRLQLNGDAAANYDYQYSQATNATTTPAESLGNTFIRAGLVPGATAGVIHFDPTRVEILDYANTARHKAVLTETFHKQNTTTGSLTTERGGGSWRSNAAVTSLTLSIASGQFSAGGVITLYGRP